MVSNNHLKPTQNTQRRNLHAGLCKPAGTRRVPKPVLKWAGGKSRLISQLAPYFPPRFRRYFEPFIGGGAVFFALKHDGESWLNDANHELINLYEVIRDTPDELVRKLDELYRQYSESFYYELRRENPSDNIDRAARLVFLNKAGFNGLYRVNSKGEFNVPFGKRTKCPDLYDPDNIAAVSEKLRVVKLSCDDFERTIDEASQGDFVYCDPPYQPISATSSFTAYGAGGFTRADQKRLKLACERAVKRGAWMVISNSSSTLIPRLYEDHRIETVWAERAINCKGTHRGRIEELCIIMQPNVATN